MSDNTNHCFISITRADGQTKQIKVCFCNLKVLMSDSTNHASYHVAPRRHTAANLCQHLQYIQS
jgi:hypothetical protein